MKSMSQRYSSNDKSSKERVRGGTFLTSLFEERRDGGSQSGKVHQSLPDVEYLVSEQGL